MFRHLVRKPLCYVKSKSLVPQSLLLSMSTMTATAASATCATTMSAAIQNSSNDILKIVKDYSLHCNTERMSKIYDQLELKVQENLNMKDDVTTSSILASESGSVSTKQQQQTVFANNYVNFENIDVIGFDLDYTLVTYTVELQRLIYDMAKDLLIHTYGYPECLGDIAFDPDFAIRGLCVDKTNGVICKLSHLQRIGLRFAYLGKKPLSSSQIEEFYGEFRTISSGYIDQMKPLNDMFAMAEACLIADVIHTLECKKDSYGELYDAPTVVDDILGAIKDVHISGAMHGAVLKDPVKFIKPSPHLRDMLVRYRKAGKKLFLCTNSGVVYAEAAIKFALGDQDHQDMTVKNNSSSGSDREDKPKHTIIDSRSADRVEVSPQPQMSRQQPQQQQQCPPENLTRMSSLPRSLEESQELQDPPEPQESWRYLFDVIICSANKPNDFFYGKKPFRKWVESTGAASTMPLRNLEQGVIYVNGSVQALRRATGWNSRRVLYIGDNLFADLTEARKTHGWQTACVIEELRDEIEVTNTILFNQLYHLRVTVRHLINDIQQQAEARLANLPPNTYIERFEQDDDDAEGRRLPHTTNTSAEEFAQFQSQFRTPADAQVIADLEIQLHSINRLMSSCFNQQFGSAFRTDGSPSMFAFAVKRYVDLYMDDVCNLSNYSPYHRFFPSHAIHMAHDPVS